jgi:hypothetical protein
MLANCLTSYLSLKEESFNTNFDGHHPHQSAAVNKEAKPGKKLPCVEGLDGYSHALAIKCVLN